MFSPSSIPPTKGSFLSLTTGSFKGFRFPLTGRQLNVRAESGSSRAVGKKLVGKQKEFVAVDRSCWNRGKPECVQSWIFTALLWAPSLCRELMVERSHPIILPAV